MEKLTIKFSHSYRKLCDVATGKPVKEAVLLTAIPVPIEGLSKDFLNYDTDFGKYELPRQGFYLMLIFQKPNGEIFTTLRTQFAYSKVAGKTQNKLDYYQPLAGRVFQIVITENTPAHGKEN